MTKKTISKLKEYSNREEISPELKELLLEAVTTIKNQNSKKINPNNITKMMAGFSKDNDSTITTIEKMDVNCQKVEFLRDKLYEFDELYVCIGDELGGYWMVGHGEIEIALLDNNDNELVRL